MPLTIEQEAVKRFALEAIKRSCAYCRTGRLAVRESAGYLNRYRWVHQSTPPGGDLKCAACNIWELMREGGLDATND